MSNLHIHRQNFSLVSSERPDEYESKQCPLCFLHDGWMDGWTDGWMNDSLIYILFNSISVKSGQWVDDNEMLCAMEPRLQLRRFPFEWGSNPGPLDQ